MPLLPQANTVPAARPSSAGVAPPSWAPRLAALVLAAGAAASLAYWGLQISATRSSAAADVAAPARLPEAAAPEQVARLLAAPATRTDGKSAASPGNRLQLTGVAAGVSGRGVAILSIDGGPPRPFAVGTPVSEGLVLQSVQGRRAQLGPDRQGPATVVLELPPLPR